MAFNHLKEFVKNPPWTNYSPCFLAMIFLAIMPRSSHASACDAPWTCSLSSNLCVPDPSVGVPTYVSILLQLGLCLHLPHPCISQCPSPIPHVFLLFFSTFLSLPPSWCHFPLAPSSPLWSCPLPSSKVLLLPRLSFHSFYLQRSLSQLGMTATASPQFLENTPSKLLLHRQLIYSTSPQ